MGINARYLWDYTLRGFNRYTFCLLKECQKRSDVEIHLYSEMKSPIHPRFQSQLQAQMHLLAAPKTLLWEQVVLPSVLRKDGIDIFHAPADGGLPWRKTAKYVLTYHHAPEDSLQYRIQTGELVGTLADFIDTIPPNGLRGMLRQRQSEFMRLVYLRAADRIITVSHFSKWQLVRLLNVPEEKVRITYLAPDEAFKVKVPVEQIQEIRSKHGICRPYLLFVSGFDKRKNVPTLLSVYAELKKLGIAECLVLAGSGGDVQAVKALARALGLVEQMDVFFLERVHDDLPALYQGATLFVSLSWEESFCFPLVEAMASGIPVVASRFGAIPEVMGDAGLTVDPREIGQVVTTVKEVLSHPELQQELRMRSLQRSHLFSWKKTADETVQVYREVTHNRCE